MAEMELPIDENDNRVKVCVRLRPISNREISLGCKNCLYVENAKTVILDTRPDQKQFNFDYVADPTVGTGIIFRFSNKFEFVI